MLYVGLDVLLIVLYGLSSPDWLPAHGAGSLAWILRVLALVDLLEDGFALAALNGRSSRWGRSPRSSRSQKWLLVLVAVVVAAYLALQHRPVIRSWLRAVYTHRFSVIAILPIAVLTVPAGSDLLDQLPDVERRWFHTTWYGDGHFWAAVVAVLLTGAGLLVLGRLRSGVFWRRTAQSVAAEEKANLWLGAVVPLVLGIGLVAVAVGVPPVAVGPPGPGPGAAAGVPCGPGRHRRGLLAHPSRSQRRTGAGPPRCSARSTTSAVPGRQACASSSPATPSWRSPS